MKMVVRSARNAYLKAVLVALVLDVPKSASAQKVADFFSPSRDPFSPSLPAASIPQFIVLTFDDGVTPLVSDLYAPLSTIRHKDGCPITATWYVSIASSNSGEILTQCGLVNTLWKGGHEIATHTYGHTGSPTADEIERARTWLSEECGVPKEEMRGFRAPFLQYTQETMESLATLGFLYDSSVTEGLGNDGDPNHIWPYTMDECGFAAWRCDPDGAVPGLYEVPMWTMYNPAAEGVPMIPMDYPGDVYSILSHNLDSRYDVASGGNRAPLGIFLHAAWLMANGDDFKRWVEDVLTGYQDVHFVTNYQLLQWMSNPVPAQQYSRRDFCANLVPSCFAPPTSEGGCGFGVFDGTLCECKCDPPYAGRNCMSYGLDDVAATTDSPTTTDATTVDAAASGAPPSSLNSTAAPGGASGAADSSSTAATTTTPAATVQTSTAITTDDPTTTTMSAATDTTSEVLDVGTTMAADATTMATTTTETPATIVQTNTSAIPPGDVDSAPVVDAEAATANSDRSTPDVDEDVSEANLEASDAFSLGRRAILSVVTILIALALL